MGHERTGRRLRWTAFAALAAVLAAPLPDAGAAHPHAPVPPAPRELLNYAAIEKPVRAERGMVVSQSEAASAAGARILRAGGNAVDAAVATAFAMAVTLPRAGNIGGDGYMLIHTAGERRTRAIDFRSTAPAAATLERYLDAQGKVAGDKAGYLAAGVPGTVAGLALAHRKHGRLPWADLLQPAIALAAEGIVLSHDEAFALDWGRQRLSLSGPGAAVFLHADGSALRAGERLLQPDLAWSLRQIAEHGEDAFYRGRIAERLAAGMARHGGLITRADLAGYRAIERAALRTTYRGVEVATMPPSSGGGASILEMLNILEHTDLRAQGAGSAAALHAMAEAIKLAWADRGRYAGDPDFATLPTAGVVSKAYAAERAKLISPTRARPAPQAPPGDPWPHESPQTTHFSVVDTDGNAVSATYTLGSDFGAGVMIEGTGFLLGNLVGNFSIEAQAEAARAGEPAPANALLPGRRPVSSMSPTLLLRDGALWMATGSPGGNTIPGTVMQMIVNVVDFGMNIAEATHAPRIHQEMRGGELRVERGLSPDTVRLLEGLGHRVVPGETIGSTQTLMLGAQGVEGAADPRRPGAGAVAE
ncbi:gamma-glutamyltransferase [Pseudoxanthomonas broegbernensis]|uniref:Glutathione hydrolase proenzyme n=1 Tax=Pseudoxanthomonas broegbernensis TaxID=83619 RepID=A0A7V8K6A6_9GAMM|nr:gamma-glutamyltransferase [Pseudoxanthomonas broegbernensis]KAF1684938.1 gamma-glutamyltransferase [Pseudoxanthomonas broegbernensis]MBB6066309.1 gamma-glutamyltranspeptidase/glutathione hydrolase [Pseudoxanthomonas broegbernensis]